MERDKRQGGTELGQMGIRAGWRCGILAFAIALLAALGAASSASADLSFCPFGSGAGQCEKPEGVGVDTSEGAPSSGHVYVADRGNNRVNVFEADGDFLFAFGWGVADGVTNAFQTCTATCFKGIAGAGSGQFSGVRGVAVDNNEASASFHDVYVYDGNNRRVQKFDPTGSFLLSFGTSGSGNGQFGSDLNPIAVGPGGSVFVGDTQGSTARVQKFTQAGVFTEAVTLPENDNIFALAVDSGGNFYAVFNAASFVHKYGPTGTPLYNLDPTNFTVSLAVDEADNLYANQTDGAFRVVTEYSSAGQTIRRFGYGRIGFNLRGLAPYQTANGDIFGSEEYVGSQTQGNKVTYIAFDAPGPVIAAPALTATAIGNAKATLKAQINPEGKATEYHFEYVDEEAFEATGFATAKSTPTTPLGFTDFKLHEASATIGCANPIVEAPEGKCLTPDTTYHFRVVATNADGTDEAESTFKTKPPLEFEFWAAKVGTDTALLAAKVNPLGIPATGYFEYVDDAAFQDSGFTTALKAPASGELDFGSSETGVTRSTTLFPLLPATIYHYRFVVDDPLIDPVTSEPQTFITFAKPLIDACPGNEAFRTGLSAALPDCRAYEMVSPLDKEGGDIIALQETFTHLPAALSQSSAAGDKLAYASYRAFGNAKAAPYTSQYIAVRDPGTGWGSHGISPPRTFRILKNSLIPSFDTEFKLFSDDLCASWLRTVTDPTLAAGAIERFPNLYGSRDSDPSCGGEGYEALTTVEPPLVGAEDYWRLELQGASEDGEVAAYVSNDNLTPDAPPQPAGCTTSAANCQLRLYVQAKDNPLPRFVCILPNGEASKTSCQAGDPTEGDGKMRTGNVLHALSDDGSELFWTAHTSPPGPGQIYLRLNPTEEQSALSGGECTEAAKACTLAVSKQAETSSGTTISRFWTAAADGSRAIFTTGTDLYEYVVATKSTNLIAHKSAGILGAGDDAQHIYMVSEEVLSGANAEGGSPTAGKQNLYVYEPGGTYRFVMTMASADVNVPSNTYAPVVHDPRWRVSRVSPDGVHAAFPSFANPTGYDNIDAVSGQVDAEVYLYDAAANAGQGGLVCASCNPTLGRPAGANARPGSPNPYWAGGKLPVWENTLYASRVLSEDGNRLFFESSDTLSPRDTNGVQDLYQWEAAGTGGCEEGDAAYYASNGGCIGLISSGQSARAVEFTDASPSGDDVFFATLAGLLPQDYGLVDVYDARVGGGLPEPPPPAAECEGESCQNPASPPLPPTPPSLVYQGPGNVSEAQPPKKCPKGKHKVKKNGKTRCVKNKPKKSKGKSKKSGAERRAAR